MTLNKEQSELVERLELLAIDPLVRGARAKAPAGYACVAELEALSKAYVVALDAAPAVADMIRSLAGQVERLRQLVKDRQNLYANRLDKTDALAPDCHNHYDSIEHTIEAFDYLLRDIDDALAQPEQSHD